MNFVSFGFAILFLAALGSRLTIGRRKVERGYLGFLLACSLFYYTWHVPAYLTIILASTTIDFLAGLGIAREGASAGRRKLLLVASLATNLGLLGFFKYADFLVAEVTQLLSLVGVDVAPTTLGLVLPMGISFYTFQSMSYTIDVYRGDLTPTRSFWRFLLFVSFFPQLMAGPIVRARDFLYQIDRPRHLNATVLGEGLYLLVRGYFLKVCIANNLGVVVDRFWGQAAAPGAGSLLALGVTLAFSFQIFCDFAGYSSIARGLAYLLGFRLPVNFNAPYIARSFSEFWTRWHISLSQWLRDYLYVPLGGNRRGPLRTLVNLMLVMLLGGLWHGAAMTFVLWGGLHGGLLVLERLLGLHRPSSRDGLARKLAWFVVVQAMVLVTWVFFRADSAGQALDLLSNLFALRGSDDGRFPLVTCLVVILPAVVLHARTFACERLAVRPPGPVERGVLAAGMLYALLTSFGPAHAFIYFQF